MRPLIPDRSPADAFGAELRRLRLERGLSQAALGELVHHSGATIGKIEKAERLPTTEFCSSVDAELKAGGRLTAMFPEQNTRGEPRPVVERRRRVERLTAVLEAAGLTLCDSDRAHVDYLAAREPGAIQVVTEWITRAAEQVGYAPSPLDRGSGEPDRAGVTGSATPVIRVTVHVFAAQDAGDPSHVL